MGIALGPYELRVQVAFDAGPFNASPTWTDVTDDVLAPEGVSFSRGARSVGGKPGPGLLDLRMRNWAEGSKVAGRWTPGVAASPWHPLKLKRRIRLQARYNGGSWVGLWGGHITDYVPKWVGAAKPVCDLSASDLLAALSLLKAFPNAILAEQLYDDPVLCYPLDDSEGSVTAGDRTSSNRPSLTVEQIGTGGAIDFGAGSVGPEGATCAAFTRVDASNGKYLALDAGVPTPFGATVAVVVLPSSASAQMTALAGVYEMFGSAITLGTSSTGKARASVSIPLEGISLTVVGTSTLATDDVSHLALTMSISGTTVTVTLYVNGAPEASGTFARGLVPNVQDLRVGGTAAGDVWDGQIANVAVYDTALSGARVTAHAAAVNGWRGEPSGYRFSRLALLAGIPGGLISTSSVGLATMGPQSVGGKTLTTALGEVAVTEQGAVDVDRDGLLRFAGRVLRRGAASVVTLDARTDILNDFEGLPYNDEGLLNDVTVSRIGGATQRAVNAASVDEYGTISDSIEVYVEDDDQALSLAEWLANINAEPQLRAPVIKVSMAALAARSPSKVAAVMALERGQRITVSDLPDGLPATTLDLFVEGLSDAWGKNDWVRTITTSSLWRNGAVWILGDPFYGVLGSTTILGY